MDDLNAKILKLEKIALISLAAICLIGGIMFGYVTAQVKNFSGIKNLRQFQPSLPSKLYDVNGEQISELFLEKRDLVPYEKLPKNLINAFVAAEDRDFYRHFGINPAAIVRAMGKNLLAGRVVQGGSTITQQLAKRLFTSQKRTIARKAIEAILALQIEKKFSKEEILEMYFNQIFLGRGCYGISAAAHLFFNKDVAYLTVGESSVLAALPSAPGKYSPLINTHESFKKHWDTLSRMVDAGYLTQEKAEKVYAEFWPKYVDSIKTEYTTKTAYTGNQDLAPYFTDYVRQILTARYGRDAVYSEGFKVYTTLNLKRQEIAQRYFQSGVERQNEISEQANKFGEGAVDRGLFGAYGVLSSVFSLPPVLVKNDTETIFKKTMVDELLDSIDVLALLTGADAPQKTIETFRSIISGISSTLKVEGAFIAVEPQTGHITSMIGGSGFSVDNQYNRAVQARRQPGSAFKPFVYGSGIEGKIIHPGTTLPDAPIVDIDSSGETWAPSNYEGNFSGMVSLSTALAASINVISVRIYDLVGADRIIQYAAKMMKVPESRFTPAPALALGSSEVTPFELCTGFAIYANRGRDVFPYAVRYVTDRDGNELANIEEEVGNIVATKEMDGSIQVIPEWVAYIMTTMMKGVIEGGTATEAIRGQAAFSKECAGKTGTTSNWSDAWFCGFTTDVCAVVWFGYDRAFMSLGKHQAGSGVAAPVWGNYMREIYNGMKDPHFSPQPAGTDYAPSYGGAGEFKKMKSVLDVYMEKEGLKEKQ
ncbi:MAG: PBP1A family penicillin-binding protein [Spirochaetes bacterium]|nr:MAG: PBP1A family penicillin-binding protein [Spirochaetota bacterium]